MRGTETLLSLNEIRFFFTRAAVGAGAPFGISEEFGKTSIWLAGLGLDPSRPAARALCGLANGRSASRFGFLEDDSTTYLQGAEGHAVSAVYTGPALADWLAVAAEDNRRRCVIVKDVDQPVLIAAAIASAEIDAQSISIFWLPKSGARLEMILKDGRTDIFGGDDTTDLGQSGTVDMKVVLNGPAIVASRSPLLSAQDIRRLRDRSIQRGVAVAGTPWTSVYGFFRKCLVPSSEQSRTAGAGAGLTDDD